MQNQLWYSWSCLKKLSRSNYVNFMALINFITFCKEPQEHWNVRISPENERRSSMGQSYFYITNVYRIVPIADWIIEKLIHRTREIMVAVLQVSNSFEVNDPNYLVVQRYQLLFVGDRVFIGSSDSDGRIRRPGSKTWWIHTETLVIMRDSYTNPHKSKRIKSFENFHFGLTNRIHKMNRSPNWIHEAGNLKTGFVNPD